MSDGFDGRFRDVFSERWEGLYVYVCRLTGDADVASDVAQEAFVRLYDRGAMPRDPGAWLVSVANNLLRDLGRKRDRRRRLLALRGGDTPGAGLVPDPGEDLDAAERRREVRATLERLPLRQRQVLLLRAGGMRYGEIAAALGMPVSSVGQTLARGLEGLRRLRAERLHARD